MTEVSSSHEILYRRLSGWDIIVGLGLDLLDSIGLKCNSVVRCCADLAAIIIASKQGAPPPLHVNHKPWRLINPIKMGESSNLPQLSNFKRRK